MARKTREEALATRSAILDAAEVVFQEQGVSKASLAEIAAAAGMTRGAVYWHFDNKIDLFDAMVQRVCGQMEIKYEELVAKREHEDPVELMRELVLYFLDRVANDPHYFRVLVISWHKSEHVGEMAEIRDKHFERGSRFIDACVTAFQTSQKQGFLPPRINPRIAAIGLTALVDGLVVNWTRDRNAFPLVETGTEVLENYLSGLRISVVRDTTKDIEYSPVS